MNRRNLTLISVFFIAFSAVGALDTTRVHHAELKKTQTYVREGLFMGGDRAITEATVKDIRRATNSGFERVVVDLDSKKSPFFQVALEPEQKRIVFTMYGRTRLGLNPSKIHSLFKKSTLISKVEIFPQLDDETWSFALHLRSSSPVEVFELTSPTRIIFDLKTVSASRVTKAPVNRTQPVYSSEEGTASINDATEAVPESDSAPE